MTASNARRGAEIEATTLARWLGGHGLTTSVVALSHARGVKTLEGVRVLGTRSLGPAQLWRLRRLAAGSDVVVAFGSSSLPACAASLIFGGTPFVYRSIGDPSWWLRGRVHRWRTGVMMRRASAIVALWPGSGEAIQRLYGVPQRRVAVIPNARDPKEFQRGGAEDRTTSRDRLGLTGDGTVVAFVGSLTHEKQPDLAIRALELLPDVTLLIAGDGPLRETVEAAARQRLGDRGRVIGSTDDVAGVLRVADVLLMTSSTEGMPGVLLEAAMAGVPFVASDVGAIRWLGDCGLVGVVVDKCGTAEDFATAIRQAASLPRQEDRAPLVRFTWDGVAPLWVELLTSRLAQR